MGTQRCKQNVVISSPFATKMNSSFGFHCLMGLRGQRLKSRATQGEEFKVRPLHKSVSTGLHPELGELEINTCAPHRVLQGRPRPWHSAQMDRPEDSSLRIHNPEWDLQHEWPLPGWSKATSRQEFRALSPFCTSDVVTGRYGIWSSCSREETSQTYWFWQRENGKCPGSLWHPCATDLPGTVQL